MLQTSLDQFLSNVTAKTKFAILAFLYCAEFVKKPNGENRIYLRCCQCFVPRNWYRTSLYLESLNARST